MSKDASAKPKSLLIHLLAGGSAGLADAITCHPLDTIKVRMQLSRSGSRHARGKQLSFFGVGVRIVRNESFFALYKGLGAVVSGIVPKMAIRFSSFEMYKGWMADANGKVNTGATFLGWYFAQFADFRWLSPGNCKFRLIEPNFFLFLQPVSQLV